MEIVHDYSGYLDREALPLILPPFYGKVLSLVNVETITAMSYRILLK